MSATTPQPATDCVAALAVALLSLSPEDRAKLAAMLLSGNGNPVKDTTAVLVA